MEKKCNVFISSTYKDLKEERSVAMEAIIEAECFPIGMKFFPASPLSPWDFIKKSIDRCDCYLLIVAGRYGSIDQDTGLSYTEREYDYAVKKGTKIFAFLSSDLNNYEVDDIEKIEKFREKVEKGKHTCAYYENKNELSEKIVKSLVLANKDNIDAYDYLYNLIGFLQEQINQLAEASLTTTLNLADTNEKIRKLKKTNNLQ